MEIRRGTRAIRKHRRKIKIYCMQLLFLSALIAQGEFQIRTLPSNAKMVANHNGFSAYIDIEKANKSYNINFIQYPADINFQSFKYNNMSISILNYGEFTDQIDDEVFYKFNAYELDFTYYYKKKILKKFLVSGSGSFVYSKIDYYNSYGLAANVKLTTTLNNLNMSFGLNNLGIILDSYSLRDNSFPLNYQFGILYTLSNTATQFGFDILYHTKIKLHEYIYGLNFSLGKFIAIRLSSNNLKEQLLIGNYRKDWFYGLNYGISFNTKQINTDIGVSSLGPAGFVYAISVSLKY